MKEKIKTGFQVLPPLPVVLWIKKRRWFKAILWAVVCAVAFLIVNTISFEYCVASRHWLAKETLVQLPGSLKWLAPRIASEFCLMAIGCGVLSGILLALSNRLLAWLAVVVIFVLATGTLGICQMVVFN
jgi:hypothetical protein